MNKFHKKRLFISILLIINILILVACQSKDIYNKDNLEHSTNINNNNALIIIAIKSI